MTNSTSEKTMNREKELEAFEKWWKPRGARILTSTARRHEESISMGAWLARAELSANDNQVIAELAETLRLIGFNGYGRPTMMIVRAREQLTKHAKRIKQAQETREGE